MSVVKIWYGWIPSLSGDVFLCDIYKALENRGFDLNQNSSYSRLIRISDVSSKLYEFSVTVPSGFSGSNDKNRLIVKLKKINVKAACEIERNGLLKLEVTYENIGEEKFAIRIVGAIYHEIKNIFHEHTHHDEEADRLLAPVLEDVRERATIEIVRIFQKKVFYYHHFLKEYLSQSSFRKYLGRYFKKLFIWKDREPKLPLPVEYVAQAEGEMLYALLFVNLFKKNLSKHSEYQFIFQNAYESFNGIRNKLTQILQDYANRIMIWLTVMLVVLTIVLLF